MTRNNLKNHPVVIVVVSLFLFCIAQPAFALSMSFGGRVLTTSGFGIINCPSGSAMGTVPVYTTGNLAAIAAGSYLAAKSDQPALKALGTLIAIYGIFPFQIDDPEHTKNPKFWDQVLGKYNIIPNFSSCYINAGYQIPFPVKETTSNTGLGGLGH